MLEIGQLVQSEINLLENLPPKEWNINLPNIVSFHYGYPYFYPITAKIDNKIIGFGNGILNNKVGWIGNIIVTPENRRQGIGYQLTNHLVEFFRERGCKSQLLIATEMGKNIYSKIGFRITSTYHFYKSDAEPKNYPINNRVRGIRQEDYTLLSKLDIEITGEERFHLIERSLATGLVYWYDESNEILGMYLPDFGSGLITATNQEAGLELLKYRISQGKTTVIVPSENSAAIDFLQKEGYQLHQVLPRMVLGDDVNWEPNFIFNRGAGYFG